MIFVLAIAMVFTAWRFVIASRRKGFHLALRELLLAIGSGLLSGIFIGFGARIGMRAIAFANNDAPRTTLSGTIAVIITFASFGGLFGIVYVGLFREILRHRGALYGILITLISWYPLAVAAMQQLRNPPPPFGLIFTTGLFVALMWIPFGIMLEKLVSLWQNKKIVSVNFSSATL